MQILEPPTSINITYDENEKAYFAEGFLFSTRRSAQTNTNKEKGIKVDKQGGHKIAGTFTEKYFMIDPQLLKKGKDSHFYGIGKDALIEGYRKKSYGQIKSVPGPYYYPDGSGDYWYNFRMKLNSSQAGQALIDLGKKFTENFNVSPHFWPEKVGPNREILDGEGVGVALVKRGAWGDEAILSKLCKGDENSCFGPKGIAGAQLSECEFGCSCQQCKKEDRDIAQIISSLVGQSGSNLSDNIMADQATAPPAQTDAGKTDLKPDQMQNQNQNQDQKNNDNNPKNPTLDPQQHLANEPQGQVIIDAAKLAKLEAAAASVEVINNERKGEILGDIWGVVSDEKERKSVIKEYSELNLDNVKQLKVFKEKLIPYMTEKIRADLQKETEAADADKDKKKDNSKKGQAGSSSSLPPEKPKEKTDANNANANKDKGEGQAGSKFTRPSGKPQIRNLILGGRK